MLCKVRLIVCRGKLDPSQSQYGAKPNSVEAITWPGIFSVAMKHITYRQHGCSHCTSTLSTGKYLTSNQPPPSSPPWVRSMCPQESFCLVRARSCPERRSAADVFRAVRLMALTECNRFDRRLSVHRLWNEAEVGICKWVCCLYVGQHVELRGHVAVDGVSCSTCCSRPF